MKCLPLSKVATAKGLVLHDWHAEVLAMRAFNRYLLDECYLLAQSPATKSDILTRRSEHETSSPLAPQPFAIHVDVKMLMYCSEAPCGDASMELIMAKQEDASPWPVPLPSETNAGLLGRGSFSELGVVRRKPGS